jgi:hypothetical protein
MPKGPQQCQRGPPCDKNQISRDTTGDISYPKEFMPSQLPLYSLPRYLMPLTSSHRTLPLQLIPGGGRAHVLFRLSELKEIKKDFGSYTENRVSTFQAFREVSQNFELSWKDVMILLSQTLTFLEKW